MRRLIRNRYELIESVGRGGQGHVFRARDRQHDRVVAVKVRPAGTAEHRAALLGEARILLALRPHPNLSLVREDFFDGGKYYLVMDWVEGQNLQDVIAEHGTAGLGLQTVVATVDMVAEALNHLHRSDPSVVHGDVKPANLIVRSDGAVVLVDFGIARADWAAGMRIAGTSGYCAPEVVAGERPTPASDVYSLAATSVALLTGHTPDGVKPEWTGLAAEVVPAVERVLFTALSVDPAKRPHTALEFSDHLRAAAGVTLLPRSTPKRRLFSGMTAGRRAAAVAAALVLLAGGSIGTMRLVDDRRPPGAGPSSRTGKIIPLAENSFPPDGMTLSPSASPSASVLSRPTSFRSPPSSSGPSSTGSSGPGLANGWRGPRMVFEMTYEGRPQLFIAEGDGSAPRLLMNDPAAMSASNYWARWSPDATKIVFVSERSGEQDIWVVDATGKNARRLTFARPDVQPDWSPDGKKLVFVRWFDEGARLVVIDAVSGERGGVRRLTNGLYDWEGTPKWSPDGSTIAFTGQPAGVQRDIFLIDAAASNGQPTQITTAVGIDTHPAWSPDGRWIAFVSGRGGTNDIYLMDRQGANVVAVTKQVTAGLPDWSADGKSIAFHYTMPSRNMFRIVIVPASSRGVGTFDRFLSASSSASGPDLIP